MKNWEELSPPLGLLCFAVEKDWCPHTNILSPLSSLAMKFWGECRNSGNSLQQRGEPDTRWDSGRRPVIETVIYQKPVSETGAFIASRNFLPVVFTDRNGRRNRHLIVSGSRTDATSAHWKFRPIRRSPDSLQGRAWIYRRARRGVHILSTSDVSGGAA
jgi:hypothetical protein